MSGRRNDPGLDAENYSPLPPISTGIRGLCPHAGRATSSAGLKLKRRCDMCGLDTSFADPADGPTFIWRLDATYEQRGHSFQQAPSATPFWRLRLPPI